MLCIHRLMKASLISYAAHPENMDQLLERARPDGVGLGEARAHPRRTPDGALLLLRRTEPPSRVNYGLPFLLGRGATEQPGLSDLPTVELVSFARVEVKSEPLRKATAALGLGEGLAEIREGRGSRFTLTLRTEDGREVEI